MKRISYVGTAFFLIILVMSIEFAYAQETSLNYNPNSVYPVHDDYVMYKKRVWRRMDLREKQNRPFFAQNNEITKIIIDAVKDGRLYPYKNDSLTQRMSKEEFLENLQLPDAGGGLTEEEKAMGFGQETQTDAGWGDTGGGGWGDTGADADASAAANVSNYFLPNEIWLMNIIEDEYFDRIRARKYHDIQAVELILPAELMPTGLEKTVGTFRYLDLEKLFRSMPNEAVWFNPYNIAQHRNLADAFLLRLFNARIIKVSNPEDLQLIDIYGGSPKDGLYASQLLEYKLMEYEHNLWEY